MPKQKKWKPKKSFRDIMPLSEKEKLEYLRAMIENVVDESLKFDTYLLKRGHKKIYQRFQKVKERLLIV